MKKSLVYLFAAGVLTLIATGCTSVYTNDAASDSKVAMVPAVYEPVIKHVNKKVMGSASVNVLFDIFVWGDSSFADRSNIGSVTGNASLVERIFGRFIPDPLLNAKRAAVYNACKASNCDLLLNSKYEITMKDYFVYKYIECTVKGFPGVEVDVVKKDINFPKQMDGKMIVEPVQLF